MTQKEMNMYFLKTYSFTINSPHAIRNGFPKKWEAVFLLLVLLKGKVDASGCSQEKHLPYLRHLRFEHVGCVQVPDACGRLRLIERELA